MKHLLANLGVLRRNIVWLSNKEYYMSEIAENAIDRYNATV